MTLRLDATPVVALHDRQPVVEQLFRKEPRPSCPPRARLSVVVLAKRFRTRRVVTFGERHFRALRPLQGGSFTLLPVDG